MRPDRQKRAVCLFILASFFSQPHEDFPLLQGVFLAREMNARAERRRFNHRFNGGRRLLCAELGRRGPLGWRAPLEVE